MIAKLKLCHKVRKTPKLLTAAEIKYRIPEVSACSANNVQENGIVMNEIIKRDKNPNNNLLVCCSFCSRLIAKRILSKRPAGGSAGFRFKKIFSNSCLIAPYILIRLRELFWFTPLEIFNTVFYPKKFILTHLTISSIYQCL